MKGNSRRGLAARPCLYYRARACVWLLSISSLELDKGVFYLRAGFKSVDLSAIRYYIPLGVGLSVSLENCTPSEGFTLSASSASEPITAAIASRVPPT